MEYVNHPRYGNKPIPSDENISESEILASHWRYSGVKFISETAISADISKQNFSIYPRKAYVDIIEMCKSCNRQFIFFALEQKYWFEELGFYVDSHCTKCIGCRKKDQEVVSLQRNYQHLITLKKPTREQSRNLKLVAMELFQLGYIKDEKLLQIEVRS